MKRHINTSFFLLVIGYSSLFSAREEERILNTFVLDEGIITLIKNDDSKGLQKALSNPKKEYRQHAFKGLVCDKFSKFTGISEETINWVVNTDKTGAYRPEVIQQLLFHIIKNAKNEQGVEKEPDEYKCFMYLLSDDVGLQDFNMWDCSEDGSEEKSLFLHIVESLSQEKAQLYVDKLSVKACRYDKNTIGGKFLETLSAIKDPHQKNKVLALMLSVYPDTFPQDHLRYLINKGNIEEEALKPVLELYKKVKGASSWTQLILVPAAAKKCDLLACIIESLLKIKAVINTTYIRRAVDKEVLADERVKKALEEAEKNGTQTTVPLAQTSSNVAPGQSYFANKLVDGSSSTGGITSPSPVSQPIGNPTDRAQKEPSQEKITPVTQPVTSTQESPAPTIASVKQPDSVTDGQHGGGEKPVALAQKPSSTTLDSKNENKDSKVASFAIALCVVGALGMGYGLWRFLKRSSKKSQFDFNRITLHNGLQEKIPAFLT